MDRPTCETCAYYDAEQDGFAPFPDPITSSAPAKPFKGACKIAAFAQAKAPSDWCGQHPQFGDYIHAQKQAEMAAARSAFESPPPRIYTEDELVAEIKQVRDWQKTAEQLAARSRERLTQWERIWKRACESLPMAASSRWPSTPVESLGGKSPSQVAMEGDHEAAERNLDQLIERLKA